MESVAALSPGVGGCLVCRCAAGLALGLLSETFLRLVAPKTRGSLSLSQASIWAEAWVLGKSAGA